ncbi:Signal transduction histidine kinase [Eubacterium aggregans]|uniref:Stage 0 sporulation protein A homolog n=1 Tax=Eubacterium aggregans TaxID=81409 RepID=A0A1H4ED21_9FIRM|nr:ATP-binding protein [Eubacterium aggregans]SEA82846.1 Signal transduction histidine kinase [Eubacterium aggregans]
MTRADVTKLLYEEEEKANRLREALIVAEQANNAKSDFLASMSHDIRTPMNAIVGMCELAIADETDEQQVHESLRTIQSSSQLLLSLINNILEMSRIESGKMVFLEEPFSVKKQIEETAKSYQFLAAQKHQKFEVFCDIEHDTCSGDVARIHSAIDNVLSNAIKYTPYGGTITYRVSELSSNIPWIGRYRFEISDTGIGISAEKQKHLFEPFFRGESDLTAKIEGTGLGLSIAKAIIDLKGGTISVNSVENVGTTFVIELPLHFAKGEPRAALPTSPERTLTAYDLSATHILVCEDHAVNQRVIQRILQKANATITLVDNGQAGYEAFLKSEDGTFDMILMDIQMPVMNGYRATKAIRESNHPQAKSIPIVAMTANAFSEDVKKSMEAGMDGHLAKPIVPIQIYEAVLQFTKGRLKEYSSR